MNQRTDAARTGLLERVRAAWRALRGRRPADLFPVSFGGAFPQAAGWSENPAEQALHLKHWVYVAVRAIRDRIAAARLRLFALENGQWRPVESHPFLDLLDHVNPVHTRWGLWAATAEFLELTGNAYWYVARDRMGLPREVWPLHSQRVRVIPDAESLVRGYEYAAQPGRTIRFDRDEVIHFRFPNPRNLHYGWSPLQAAAEAVDAHEEMLRAQLAAFRQGVQPPKMFFSTPQVISDESALARLQERLESRYAGPESSQRVMVAHGGLKPERLSLTPQEMDFLRSKRATRDEILSVFGVPAAIGGIAEDVNRSSADAMERIFARNTVAPKLALIAQQIQQDLLPAYPAALRCEFDQALPEDREQVRADAVNAFDRGALTVDELRETLTGRAPLGDDRTFTRSTLRPRM